MSTDGASAVLEFERVSHRFGALTAVDDFSLSVAPGELVCLVGPSGCGKTTALRIAAGLESLQAGRVSINGQVVADAETGMALAPELRGVGLVFQDYALFPHLSVADNVAFGLRDMAGAARTERVAEVLRQVDMASYARAYPHTLSGGQQQRVALARALAPRPRLMLLDEPFSGMDARLRDEIRDATLHVLKESGAATLIITHDPEEAMFMADRIAVMRAGRLVQIDVPVDIYCHPVDAFVAGFFGQTNRISGRVEGGAVNTPFGSIAADALADGSEVLVLIRPEAVRVTPIADDDEEPENAAKVIASRMLGRSSLIHLCVGDFDAAHLHFHSRMPGRLLPGEDEIVAITLDPSQIFVFPVETA
jgi:iron(III) transport system ATP-binding protein